MTKTHLKLGLKDQGRFLTDEEFAQAECDAPYRYERVEKRLVVMEPSDLPHMQVVSAILEKLYVYRHTHSGAIELIAPEGWIRTSDQTDRVGDIAVYLDDVSADHIYDLVPDLVFEVVSRGSEERDYIFKRGEYFDIGVEEYVIVDPFRQVVTVLSRGEHGYLVRELREGDVYNSDQLPGSEFPIVNMGW